MLKKITCSLAVFAIFTGACLAQEWGTVKGKVVYDGDAPAVSSLKVTKDIEVCGKHKLVDESVVVGEGGGLANVVPDGQFWR